MFRRVVPRGTESCLQKWPRRSARRALWIYRTFKNYKQPFCTTLTTDCVEIPKPTIQRLPDKMAEEASTGGGGGGAADNQPLSINQIYSRTTVTNLPTNYVEIGRLAPLTGFGLKWPRRPVRMTLQMNSVSTKFWTLIKRQMPRLGESR